MSVLELTKDNFQTEVREEDIPVIVDFWAEWCGPCKIMAPVFEELSEEYKEKLRFAKLNTEKYPDLAGNYDIRAIPCLILLHKGKEVDRIIGYMPKDSLKLKINAALEKV